MQLQTEVLTQKVAAIGNAYLASYKNNGQQKAFSLLGGRGSSILVQYLFLRHTGKSEYKDELEYNIDYLIDKIEQTFAPYPSFCDGLAGMGWLLLYLSQHGLLEVDDTEFFEDMDQVLAEALARQLRERDFDLLHGALGIGLYFLKRGLTAPVENIISALDAHAEMEAYEVRWRRYDKYHLHQDIYDFGLAHGQASILYFLGKCCREGVLVAKCRKLIKGGFDFYLNNVQDVDAVGSFFKDSIPAKDYKAGHYTPSKSRLAWCYGDLGILHTLLMVSIWLEEKEYNARFESMLVSVSRRREFQQTSVKDAQFCHGASGLGYMYLNAFHLTGNLVFREAAEYWAATCLEMGNSDSESAGYLFHMGDSGWLPSFDLLGGLGGVAVLLLSCRDSKLPHDWNECLMLS